MVNKVFQLKKDYTVYIPRKYAVDNSIINKDFTLYGNRLTVSEGFSWDGCSPKFRLFGKVWGTPDGRIVDGKPITWEASLVHDILYKYLESLPFIRKEVDKIFYELLKRKKFKWAKVYYIAVRRLGGIYHNARK